MFGAAEGAEPFPVVDDAFSQALPNAGERFKVCDSRGVDVDTLRDCVIRRGSDVGRIARLLIVRLWSN